MYCIVSKIVEIHALYFCVAQLYSAVHHHYVDNFVHCMCCVSGMFQEQTSTSHAGMSPMPNRPTMYAQEGVQPPGYHTRMPTSHRMPGPPYAGHYDSVMVGGGAMLPPGMSPQQHQQMMMSSGWAPEFYRPPGPVPTSNRMMYPMAVRGPPPAPQNTAAVPVTASIELSQAESRATSGQTHQKTDADDVGDKSEGDQFEDLIGTVHFYYLSCRGMYCHGTSWLC